MNFQSSLFREIQVEDISRIFKNSLGEEQIWEAQLLKGGMFNTTYLVCYGSERKKAVLRLDEKVKKTLYNQMGKYLYSLHQVTGKSFGYVSRIQEGKCFETWSDALIFEVEDITKRLETLEGLNSAEAEAVREMFCQNRQLLDEVTVPHLLHTDLWEGNVLLDKERLEILAIIDSDRAVFGDPDFEFASSWMGEPDLLEGYGSEMSKRVDGKREKRRQLYRIFYMLIEAYVGLGEYNNPDMYRENKERLCSLVL